LNVECRVTGAGFAVTASWWFKGIAHECVAVVAPFYKRWSSSGAVVAHGGARC